MKVPHSDRFLNVDGFFTTCHSFPFVSCRWIILVFARNLLQSQVMSHLPDVSAHNQHCAPGWSTVFSLTELVKHLLGGLKAEMFCSLRPVNGNKTCKTTVPLSREEQKGAKKRPCFLPSKYCMKGCFLQHNLQLQCAAMLLLSQQLLKFLAMLYKWQGCTCQGGGRLTLTSVWRKENVLPGRVAPELPSAAV